MKKLIAKKLVLLAAVLLAGVGSASAFEVDGLTYRVIDNDAKTVRVMSLFLQLLFLTEILILL